MPHPAISEDYHLKRPVQMIYAPSWSPLSDNILNELDTEVRTFRQEPASTNNPVRADGTRAPAAYHIRRLTIANPPAFTETTNTNGWFQKKSSIPSSRLSDLTGLDGISAFNAVMRPLPVAAENLARQAFLKKLQEASSRAELGVFAGEFRETVDLASSLSLGVIDKTRDIAHELHFTPKSVSGFLQDVEKGRDPYRSATKRFGSIKTSIPQRIIDSWLVFQFGIQPLVKELPALTAALKTHRQAQGSSLSFERTVRGGSKVKTIHDIRLQGASVNASRVGIMGRFEQVDEVHFSCRYKVPVSPALDVQYGFNNPFALPWELVRLSWMCDYFLDIGGWLNSWYAGEGTSFVEGSMSRISRTRLQGLNNVPLAGTEKIKRNPSLVPMMIEADYFKRDVLTAAVKPPGLPSFKQDGLGLTRLANVMSALTKLRFLR